MVTYKEAEKIGMELAGLNKKEIVLMTKFSPVPYTEEILKENKIIYDKDKILWRYDSNEGIWKSNAEQYIKTNIRLNLLGEEQQKKNYVEEIISHIKDICYREDFVLNNNPNLIAFKNGVFDLRDNQFKPFKEEFFITNKINIEINNQKDCPLIDKCFGEWIGEEYKEILYDLCAYCLYRDQPYQKLFFIFGQANTGKSQFLNLLELFLGVDNFCSVEPQKIQTDPYAAVQMWLKFANIVSDINFDALENINQIKKMTGGDTIMVREIYKSPFKTKIYAKQIFSTNKLPIVKEKTRAWYRRVYLIEFNNVINEKSQDPYILEKMKKELSGLASVCLTRLCKLKERKFVFTFDMDINRVTKVYEELSNPILRFIRENCIESVGNSSFWVFDYEFKERLNNWLSDNHFPRMTRGQINDYMKEVYNDSNRPSFNGEKNYRVWIGLKWANLTQNDTQFNQFNHFRGFEKTFYSRDSVFKTPLNPLNPLNASTEVEK